VAIVSFFPLLIITLAISKATGFPAIAELLISSGIFAVAAAAWRKVIGWMGFRRRRAIEETEQAIEQKVDRLASAPDAHSDETEQLRLRT
jgi:hypothetical protein